MAPIPLPHPGRFATPMVLLPLVGLAVVLVLFFVAPSLVVEVSTGDFMLVTLFLGGGAAWLTGRAVAKGWTPYWQVVVYCLLLTGAVRFCHFALFHGTLALGTHAIVEFILLVSIASLGFRAVRRRQMTERYEWLYEPAGTLAWRTRADAGDGTA